MATETMQNEINRVLARFSDELLTVFQRAVVQAVTGRSDASLAPAAPRRGPKPAKAPVGGAKVAKPAKGGRRRGGPKSSPEEVAKLGDTLVEILRRNGNSLPAKELLSASGANIGQFNYALNKAKADGRIVQIGQRRMARYQVGSGKAGKPAKIGKPAKATKPAKGKPGRKPGRKPAPAPAAAPAAAQS